MPKIGFYVPSSVVREEFGKLMAELRAAWDKGILFHDGFVEDAKAAILQHEKHSDAEQEKK